MHSTPAEVWDARLVENIPEQYRVAEASNLPCPAKLVCAPVFAIACALIAVWSVS